MGSRTLHDEHAVAMGGEGRAALVSDARRGVLLNARMEHGGTIMTVIEQTMSGENEQYIERVVRALHSKLRAAAAAHGEERLLETVLGPADELAERVTDAVPAPSRVAAQIGPLYRQAALARVWECSRQAVHDRIAKRKLLAVTTSDGVTLVPAFQLDSKLRPVKRFEGILATLSEEIVDDWTLASWLCVPQDRLHGRSIAQAVRSGAERETVDSLVHAAAARWSR